MQQYLESDFVRAPAALDRMSDALGQYVQQAAPASVPSAGEAK